MFTAVNHKNLQTGFVGVYIQNLEVSEILHKNNCLLSVRSSMANHPSHQIVVTVACCMTTSKGKVSLPVPE